MHLPITPCGPRTALQRAAKLPNSTYGPGDTPCDGSEPGRILAAVGPASLARALGRKHAGLQPPVSPLVTCRRNRLSPGTVTCAEFVSAHLSTKTHDNLPMPLRDRSVKILGPWEQMPPS